MHRQYDRDAIAVAIHARAEFGLDVVMQTQAFADVVQRHSVALLVQVLGMIRIGELDAQPVARHVGRHRDDTALHAGLDAVIHRVLHQRLQDHRRNQHSACIVRNIPFDREAVAKTQQFEVQVLPAQRNLVGERHCLTRVRHHRAKQVREILDRGFGTTAVAPHQGQHRVQTVEQKMRPDTRLQRLQSRLGKRGGQGTLPEIEIHRKQADQNQRPCRISRAVPGAPDLAKRVRHRRHRRRERRCDCPRNGQPRGIRQAPENGGKQVERSECRDQCRFQRQRHRCELVGEFRQALRAQRRRRKACRIRREQNPRNDTEIAKVRQGVAGIDLPYTS